MIEEPTVSLAFLFMVAPGLGDYYEVSQSVPVSCTGISTATGALITVGSDGTISAKFTIVAGTSGPPCGAAYLISTCPTSDSSGGNPTTDAANYPCPPTAAQQAMKKKITSNTPTLVQ